jgi:filamentous hemagglutinin family protein
MPVRSVAFRSHRTLHVALLAGVSVLTLLSASPAQAKGSLSLGSIGSPAANAAAAALASVQQAANATAQARSSLARATQAIQAMQQAQSAARNLSLQAQNLIPDGLAVGGLQVAPNANTDLSVWQGANQPSQSQAGGQTTVTIQQTAQKAIATWTTFNVSKNTTVHFDQSAGTQSNGNNDWVILNRIQDPSGVPSQIRGQIKAEGSVYLINRNGIIFGAGSQVNVHSLIASSLGPLGEDLLGLTPGCAAYDSAVSGSNSTFLDTGFIAAEATDGSGGGITPNVVLGLGVTTPVATPDAYVVPGDITIEAGASITSHVNGTQGNGGFVLIAAPQLTNAGSVSTPDGQAILAAGIGVSFVPLNSSVLTPELTGQLRYGDTQDVTPVSNLTNTGLVQATRGAIDLLGTNVMQNGVVA